MCVCVAADVCVWLLMCGQVMLKAVSVYEGLCLRMRNRFHSAGRVIARLILPKLKVSPLLFLYVTVSSSVPLCFVIVSE